jgi:hypothetical protein
MHYAPDRLANVTALLDWLCASKHEQVQAVFQKSNATSPVRLLEQVSASVTELAYQTRGTPSAVNPPSSGVFAGLLTTALRPHFPHEAEDRLHLLGELLVWTADGMLDGAKRGGVSAADAGNGLLAAWRGILAGWARQS